MTMEVSVVADSVFNTLATEVARKFDLVSLGTPTSVSVARDGLFAVVIASFGPGFQLRIHFFESGTRYQLVEFNFLVRPMSTREWSIYGHTNWEHVRDTYRGTPVQVLDDRAFGEFMGQYDHMNPALQEILDGRDLNEPLDAAA